MALQQSGYHRVSLVNSTSTPLSSGATFTGEWEECLGAESVLIAVKTDQDGTAYMQFSPDKINTDSSLAFAVYANSNEVHRLSVTRRYYRFVYTNGTDGAQTYLRAQSLYGSQAALTSGLNTVAGHNADSIISRSISEELMIAENQFQGYYIENKFGQNTDVDAAEDIWDGGGNYTGFPAGNAETVTLISSSANDTSGGTGMQTMRVYGLDANYNLQNELVTMNGTVGAATVNTYKRVFRARGVTAGSGTANAGVITVRHTTTTANVFSVIQPGNSQSQITNYTIPAGYRGHMNSYRAYMYDTTANQARMAIWVRDNNGCVRITQNFSVSTAYDSAAQIYGGLAFEEKTDLIFRALAVKNANAEISVTWTMILALQ